MTVLLASAEEAASAKTKDRAKKDLIVTSSRLENQTTSGLTKETWPILYDFSRELFVRGLVRISNDSFQ